MSSIGQLQKLIVEKVSETRNPLLLDLVYKLLIHDLDRR